MKKSTLYHGGSFYRIALSLAIPIAFQNLLTSCATLIDTAMVVGLGNTATSAMGVATRFSFLLNVTCFGFSSGCSALLSQHWGAKDEKNVAKTLGFAMTISLAFGIIYAIAIALFPYALSGIFTDEEPTRLLTASYLRIFTFAIPFVVFCQIFCVALRSVECVVLPLVSSAIAVVINVFVNYALIGGHFGFPALGLRGAALGTVVSSVAQCSFLLLCLLFGKTPFHGRLKGYLSFDKLFCAKYMHTAFPALFNETLWAVGTNVYVTVLARQGVENHSGYTLFENIQQLFFVFFVGICGACAVMVGMRVGSGDHDGAYEVAKKFSIMTPVMGLILGAFLILLRDPILSIFPVETTAARDVASACLFFYGLWLAMRMIPYTMVCGIFRSGGDTKSGCVFDFVGLFGMGIPALFFTAYVIRPVHFITLVAVMFIAEDTLKGILCIRHFRSRKWIKQITETNNAGQSQ